MTITLTHQISPVLLVSFVLESALAYPNDGDIDGRLACWWRGEGRWAVAWCNRAPAGIACVVPLDAGPHAGACCLYWLEVLPAFQRQGAGRALLQWAATQAGAVPLLIASTPEAAAFYRRYLSTATETTPNTFLVKGGDASLWNSESVAAAPADHQSAASESQRIMEYAVRAPC